MQQPKYKAIEKKLGIRFKKRSLLKLALTHSSFLQTEHNRKLKSNETLEFLGDAVLELIVRGFLYEKFPNANEGRLSEAKKIYTNTEALYYVGKKLKLGKFLIVDKGEEFTGGRDRPSNIAGCLEAIIGALYIDRGLVYTRKFVNRVLLKKRLAKQIDYKSFLNQWVMRSRCKIYYKVIKEEGPPHHKTFCVNLYINRKRVSQGIGESKKKAEQEAAKNFLRKKG
jgi:ribonuclease-3